MSVKHFNPSDTQIKFKEDSYYTVIPNRVIKNMSIKNSDMFLVWTYLQSMRFDWEPNSRQLMKHFGFKRDKWHKIYAWLIKAKLIEVEQGRAKDGSFLLPTITVLDGQDFWNPDQVCENHETKSQSVNAVHGEERSNDAGSTYESDDKQPGAVNTGAGTHRSRQTPTHNKYQYTNQDQSINNKCKTEANASDVIAIFEYWVMVMNKDRLRTKLGKKREAAIKRALKSHGLDVCKQAIDGCKRSSYHRGENPSGKIYDELELILRDETKIESFANTAAKSKPKGSWGDDDY